MRKILLALAAVIMLAVSTVAATVPGGATVQAPTSATIPCDKTTGKACKTPAIQATPDSTDAAATGWAMGGYPDYWDICAANGVGGTYWPYLVDKWNWAGHEIVLHPLNRCDGYSITNRFTYEYFTSTTESCGKITNTHKTWSPARGRYIWDQNPILWVNLAGKCTANNDPTTNDHQIQEYVGWLLGLAPDNGICSCVMGNTTTDRANVRFVVLHDVLDMDVVYNH
jgi:hypothetical protein